MRALLNLRQVRLFATKQYTKSHEWIQYFPEKKTARIGITDYAQQQLGEIIHIQMPSVKKSLEALDSAVVVESVKIAGDVYTPIKGTVTGVNLQVAGNPALVNADANKSWLIEVTCTSEPQGLLNEQAYNKYLGEQHH